MIEVWGRRNSSNVQAVIWCLVELNLPYKRYDIGHRHGGNTTPEFLAMNPNGTIPVLRDNNSAPLWESAAILRYLSSKYGNDTFWPKDPLARAQVDKWAEWAKVNFGGNFSQPVFWQVVRTPPSKRDAVAIGEAVGRVGRVLDIAEEQLGRNRFIAGEEFTMADVQFGHLLFRYFDIEIERGEERPCLRRYYEGLVEREAFREHVMVDYGELRVFD
ncbi:hypothetical protein FE257_007029 [Aspergillus nanangensis]|uniref:Glutathione S-transferase n=1 Tax=Aspergillus nanangensis TaxID=2582783 RepID=A0AAD4GVQ7_ASPNN|nr:hypothetical protein FE257_007029 [Aspergillus nanangensis]